MKLNALHWFALEVPDGDDVSLLYLLIGMPLSEYYDNARLVGVDDDVIVFEAQLIGTDDAVVITLPKEQIYLIEVRLKDGTKYQDYGAILSRRRKGQRKNLSLFGG